MHHAREASRNTLNEQRNHGSGVPQPVRRLDASAFESGKEWLVANGLGGYASGPVAGDITRRYHGLLVAALPAPLGRQVMVSHLDARIVTGDRDALQEPLALTGFRLVSGLPVWRYECDGLALERRIFMPHGQNTTIALYGLVKGTAPVRLALRPYLHVRHYEQAVCTDVAGPYTMTRAGERYEMNVGDALPRLRFHVRGRAPAWHEDPAHVVHSYEQEEARGYECTGGVWSPGALHVDVMPGDDDAAFAMSVESWDAVAALSPADMLEAEIDRRTHLIKRAGCTSTFAAELVLAADQFIIAPDARPADEAREAAHGSEARTVIAGYHWFTDWGRDTMIALEGLTLTTGREAEAAYILRTFAGYVKDGLLPNMFPDAEREGLYHTADATLWFFHALGRYAAVNGDRDLVDDLLPVLADILEHHVRGTRFGIGVDPADGLLVQGAPGLALTWMDASMDGWVVTPRRGKAVEINALFYNALRLFEDWVRQRRGEADARAAGAAADRAKASFNKRFWYDEGQHLYDVVDGEQGDDPACRPNQLLAVSLPHPILDASRWQAVVNVVREQLLTPFGLRSLAPGHPAYCPRYCGDLRTRDGAYHQGTVWAWLIGPMVDAWLRVAPAERDRVHGLVLRFEPHLSDAGIGSVSEIFDADPPFMPRGCIAQAWSVAELLRVFSRTAPTEAAAASRAR